MMFRTENGAVYQVEAESKRVRLAGGEWFAYEWASLFLGHSALFASDVGEMITDTVIEVDHSTPVR